MENGQSVQQPSQVEATTSKSENTKPQQTSSKSIVLYLLRHYPWVFLIGLSVIFLCIAALAFHSLSSVGSVEQTQLEDQEKQPEVLPTKVEQPTKTQSDTDELVEVEQPTNTESETANPISLWMVVAIALSCAGGCLIVLRCLNQPARIVHKPKNRYQARLAQRYQQQSESLPSKNTAILLPPSQTPIAVNSPETKPVATVLPPKP